MADIEDYDISPNGALRNEVFGAGDGDVEEDDIVRSPHVDVILEESSPDMF